MGSKNFELVNYLVELGADVNATNFKSQNAILLSMRDVNIPQNMKTEEVINVCFFDN